MGHCPHCGRPIEGIEAAGPSLHTVAPCGHFVDETQLRELLYGTSTIATGRERHATVQDRDGDRYITDGGTHGVGMYAWDGEDCPRSGCDGELQNQDTFNVMCLSCREVWTHLKDETEHFLLTPDDDKVATLPREEPPATDDDLVTDGGELTACPECDSTRILSLNPASEHGKRSQTSEWYCQDCKHHFDEPATRPPKDHTDPRTGLAAALADPSVDSVDDLDDDQLATDGGHPLDPTHDLNDEAAIAAKIETIKPELAELAEEVDEAARLLSRLENVERVLEERDADA